MMRLIILRLALQNLNQHFLCVVMV